MEDRKLTETEIMFGALDRIVREEMKKKPSKRDETLIDECIAEMAKLKNVRSGYTEEEIAVIVEQLQEKAAEKSRGTSGKPKRVRRLAAVICAACLIMGCGIACVAWNPFEVVKDWLNETLQLPVGSVVESLEITYNHHGKTEKYNTIEALIENENLDIYYPSVLPNNVHIQEIETITINNSDCIKIYFNNPNYEFTVQKNTPLYINISEYETVDVNGVTYYIAYQNDQYIARAYIASDLYFIESENYQDIHLLVNNIIKGN